MTVQTDFLERCKALNLHDGKLSDWLDEIESLRQQLAAALAACKLKNELISDACTAIAFYGEQPHQSMFDALAIQPDDSALREWLGEPVAWMITYDGKCMGFVPTEEANTVAVYSPKGLK